MKRKAIRILMFLILALAMFTSCSWIKGQEKGTQVILEVEGKIHAIKDVTIFNNAVVETPETPEGKIFLGWTGASSWNEDDAQSVEVLANKVVIRYNDVEQFIKGKESSVTIKAVFGPAPRRDLVVAWYNKESTSGLNQDSMNAFQTKLYDFLKSEGYKPESMDIAIRGYEGGVADTCSAISNDKDVDLMVGWSSSSNLTGTGGWTEGVDFVENVGNITIGAKARYTARISDTELCLKVYQWIQKTYGDGVVAAAPATTPAPAAEAAPAPAPVAEPTPTAEPAPVAVVPTETATKVVIAWYNKEATSGLNQDYMDAFQAKLVDYLKSVGYNTDALEIVVRGYEGTVGETCAKITADKDVDLTVGWAATSNLTGTGGWVEGTDFVENVGNVTIGAKARYSARITSTDLALRVYYWIQNTFGEGGAPELPPVAEVSAPANKLVVGWYAKTGTSGLDDAIMTKVQDGVNAALAAAGYSLETVVFRPYDGVVADVQAAVLADADVDVMVGMKAFALEGIEMEVEQNIAMGEKTDRRIHRVSNTDVANFIFGFLKSDEGKSLFKAN